MIYELTREHELSLYNYYLSTRKNVPYYFPADFDSWRKSMLADCDENGASLFSELNTLLLMNNLEIEGFIQFGKTNFAFDQNGKRDYAKSYGIIRNIHHKKTASGASALYEKAKEYFDDIGIDKRYAFFHYFGMSCYARQGKLHESEYYIEDSLREYGYIVEHENVYFSKSLYPPPSSVDDEIEFKYHNNQQSIDFIRKNDKIGGCELLYLPDNNICFLKWIYIDNKYGHQGLGTKCMSKLFDELSQKCIVRLDTDTASTNQAAQGYYRKMGFEDKGRMRSYFTQ